MSQNLEFLRDTGDLIFDKCSGPQHAEGEGDRPFIPFLWCPDRLAEMTTLDVSGK